MPYRTILVSIDHDRRNAVRLGLCLGYARAAGAHLVGLHVLPPPMVPYAYGEAAVSVAPELIERERAYAAERGEALRAAFDAACRREGVASCEWRVEEGDQPDVFARHARYADLTVVGQTEPDEPEARYAAHLPERVALGGGGPVLVVPYAGEFATFGRRPLVAWDGSREAARALRDALPLLQAAPEVVVLEVDPTDGPGLGAVEAAKLLARHGVRANAEYTVSAGVAVGDVLLSRLADFGCDCAVMGCYGHSRVRELVLGGATRSLLDHMTVPVLMSH